MEEPINIAILCGNFLTNEKCDQRFKSNTIKIWLRVCFLKCDVSYCFLITFLYNATSDNAWIHVLEAGLLSSQRRHRAAYLWIARHRVVMGRRRALLLLGYVKVNMGREVGLSFKNKVSCLDTCPYSIIGRYIYVYACYRSACRYMLNIVPK